MKHRHIKELARRNELILGSRSPRRKSLLEEIPVPFEQIIPRLEEKRLDHEEPYDFACRLAEDKALSIAQGLTDRQIVLGCDTIVVLDGDVLGKPANRNDALDILMRLVGNRHTVCTALALASNKGLLASAYALTEVFFNPVSRDQLEEYIGTGEPMDKAGAYGIQGMGGFLVDRIEGSLDNVIGLPRDLLDDLAEGVIGF